VPERGQAKAQKADSDQPRPLCGGKDCVRPTNYSERFRIVVEEPTMSRMNVRYVVVTLLWTAAFTAGGAFLAGFGSGLLFAAQAGSGGNPAGDAGLIATVANVWVIAPLVGCALALFLCAFSRLPGTKLPEEAET
jgi:hypothetical protein